jgi:quercetin dioxygenase-like cupin family protein
MIIHKAASRADMPASPDYFTGAVHMQPVITEASAPSRVRAVTIDFEPGARTAWHTHPAGQTLYVLSGSGLAQVWGGPVQSIKAGDTVWFEPGEKHWHGAATDSAMSHLAVQEFHEGRTVDWLEPVSEDQYSVMPE